MAYLNTMTVKQARYFNLFDNVQYKYVRELINDDDNEIDVEIKDLPCDRACYGKVSFKFKLRCDVCPGSLSIWKTSTFTVELEYNTSSPYAFALTELQEYYGDEEDEEDEEEEEE